jgi:arylsulfatase A-like enzyme
MKDFRLFLMCVIRQLVCLVWLAVGALAASPNVVSPNIVLITLDTVRADRMGFLGSTRGLTPNLDDLARQSVVFTRAYTQAPLTPTSHVTILTGTYPQFHKVDDFAAPLAKELPYAPEILGSHGYRTAAFVGSVVLDPQQGSFARCMGRGFDTYDAGFTNWHPGLDRFHTTERRAHDVVAHALAWLGEHPQGPFFMWVHLYDPHSPYEPPEPYKTKYAAAPYDGEISYTDSAVGELLSQLRARGLYDASVIAVMADHGEGLGDHGEEYHGYFLYDETIHVPLVIKLPLQEAAGKDSAGKRIDNRVELVDVLPTILQAANVAIPKEVQGESLLDVMMTKVGVSSVGKAPAESTENDSANSVPQAFRDRPAYAETDYPRNSLGWSPVRALRTGKYLYIQAPRAELYDESVDPNAGHNLASTSTSAAVSGTLAAQLDAFRQKTSSNIEAPKEALDPEAREKLAALGYLTSGSSAPKAGAALVDPKDKIKVANQLAEATFLMHDFRFSEAIPLLEKANVEEPGMLMTNWQLGKSYTMLKEYAKALPALRKVVELDSDSGNPHFELGAVLLVSGDAAAAVPELEIAVKKLPRVNLNLAAVKLATAYAESGRVREAITECEIILDASPRDYGALLLEGRLLVLSKHPDAALPELEKAAALQPKSPEPRAFLADAFDQLGRRAEGARERAAAKRLMANRPDVQTD